MHYAAFELSKLGAGKHRLALLQRRQQGRVGVYFWHEEDDCIHLLSSSVRETTMAAHWCKCGLGVEVTFILPVGDDEVPILYVKYLSELNTSKNSRCMTSSRFRLHDTARPKSRLRKQGKYAGLDSA